MSRGSPWQAHASLTNLLMTVPQLIHTAWDVIVPLFALLTKLLIASETVCFNRSLCNYCVKESTHVIGNLGFKGRWMCIQNLVKQTNEKTKTTKNRSVKRTTTQSRTKTISCFKWYRHLSSDGTHTHRDADICYRWFESFRGVCLQNIQQRPLSDSQETCEITWTLVQASGCFTEMWRLCFNQDEERRAFGGVSTSKRCSLPFSSCGRLQHAWDPRWQTDASSNYLLSIFSARLSFSPPKFCFV